MIVRGKINGILSDFIASTSILTKNKLKRVRFSLILAIKVIIKQIHILSKAKKQKNLYKICIINYKLGGVIQYG